MNDAESLSTIDSLYFRWNAFRAAGRPVEPAELCRDRPELLPALQRRIADERSTDEEDDQITKKSDRRPEPVAAEYTGAYVPEAEAVAEAEAAPPGGAADRYQVVGEHARGGMGRVSAAVDTELNRRVAFKDIQPQFADDPAARHRFTREALITGQLEHPGVIPVYGLGTDAAGRPFYAMRFVEGESLKDAVKEFHRRPPRGEPVGAKAVAFRGLLKRFADVCNAVAFAHSKRIVHRDLKPANVMLGPFGETLVVDWGLARSFADRSPDPRAAPAAPAGEQETADLHSTAGRAGSTRTGQVMGTPAYMSPEQATGNVRSLGPAWDIYSLGATLYEVLTGRPPFTGKSLGELLADIRRGDYPAPRAVAPWVPQPLEAVVRKAMAAKPADRYASALELAAEVERYLADEPVRAHRESLGERARRWAKRHPVVVRTVLALLLVGTPALAGGLYVVNAQKKKAEEAEIQKGRALDSERLALSEKSRALVQEKLARGQADQALVKEQAARTEAERNFAQTRATLDLTTDAVVGKILAKQTKLGTDERAFLEKLAASYVDFAAAPGASPRERALTARARLRAAQIRDRLGDARGAATEYRAAIDALKLLAAAPGADAELTRALGTAYLGLATALMDTDTVAGLVAVKDSLQIRQAALIANPRDLDRLHENGNAILEAADLLAKVKFNADAESLYRQYIKTYEPLVLNRVLGRETVESLGRAYERLALLEEEKSPPRYDDAYRTLDSAVALFAALERNVSDEPRYRHLRANARTAQVPLLIRAKKHEEAEQVIAPLVETQRDLVRRFPAVREYREGYALALVVQVSAFDALGKRAESLRALEQARAALARLSAEYPEIVSYRRDFVKVLKSLEKSYRAAGRTAEADDTRAEAEGVERSAPQR